MGNLVHTERRFVSCMFDLMMNPNNADVDHCIFAIKIFVVQMCHSLKNRPQTAAHTTAHAERPDFAGDSITLASPHGTVKNASPVGF